MNHSEDYRWFPRAGRVTALDAIDSCHGCEKLFYIEGLACVNWNDEYSEIDLNYCDECAKIRGYELEYKPGWGYSCPKGKVWL